MAVVFNHSKNTRVYANNFGLSSAFSSVTFDHSVDIAEVTTFDDSDRTYIPGVRDGSLSMDGYHDGSTAETDRKLQALAGGNAVVATIGMPDDSAGSRAMLINGRVTNWTVTSPAGDVVKANVSVGFSSQAWSGVWLSSRATRATATTGATVTLPGSSASTRGAIAHLHVFTNTTSATTAVEFSGNIQDSSNGSVWADLINFTNVSSTSTTGTHERATVTGTVYDRARFRADVQGSTSVEYACALARL
jgi:hypothetical protein